MNGIVKKNHARLHWALLCLTVWTLPSCGPASVRIHRSSDTLPQPPHQADKTPAQKLPQPDLLVKFQGATWKSQWSGFAANALQEVANELVNDPQHLPALVQTQIREICPRFFSGDSKNRLAFWVVFMASYAYAESDYKTSSQGDLQWGNYGSSRGLFQLSLNDWSAWGHGRGDNLNPCLVFREFDKGREDTPADNFAIVHDPEANIRCSAAILRDQVMGYRSGSKSSPGRLWTEQHYYWSVLTKQKTKIMRVFAENIPQDCENH